VRFEFAAKLAYECPRGPGGGITEGADRVARDVARMLRIRSNHLVRLAIFDPVQNLLHPVAALRHGLHCRRLGAKNRAKGSTAARTMQVVSSITITPPEPSRLPAAWTDS